MDFSVPVSALDAHGVTVAAAAHNIANVNTDEFKSQVVRLESGPLDRGVQVAAVYRDLTPGPVVLYNMNAMDVRAYQDFAAQGMRNSVENYDTAAAQDVTRTQQADTLAAWEQQKIRAGQDSISRIYPGHIEGSNTDLPREFVNLIISEFAYSANAAVIRTMDELTGSLINVKV
ncbi:MAG: hypothetical protein LBO77_02395 [Desulfovibrio sp.]|jgi:flagellar hook protein FlgE|nr:hypothetical protein [Desulfovibrio sp.]